MRKLISFALLLLFASVAWGQNPQTGLPAPPLFAANSKYTNGVAPGYWPTPGAGLTLNVSAGTVWCNGTVQTYAGGTLSMTDNTTNYVYLNAASFCAPATSTSVPSASQIPIAKVVTASGVITSITDNRTPFQTGNAVGPSGGPGLITGVGVPTGACSTPPCLYVPTDSTYPGASFYQFIGSYSGLPLVVNYGTAQVNTTGNITVPMVRTIVSGDLLVGGCISGNGNSPGTVTTGWTSIFSSSVPTPGLAADYKVATGGDVGTSIIPFNINQTPGAVCVVYEIANFSSGSPIASSNSGGSEAQINSLTSGNLLLVFSTASQTIFAPMPGTVFCGSSGWSSSSNAMFIAYAVPLVTPVVANGSTVGWIGPISSGGTLGASTGYVQIGAGSATVNYWAPVF